MKRILTVAAIATLAACSQSETAPEPVATEEAAPETPEATTAADGGPSHGMFKVTEEDGTVVMVDVKEDGTYEVKGEDGAVIDTGTWVQKSPAVYCETSSTEGATERCYDESVDENGVYKSVNPEGKTATVERVTT